LSDNGTVIVKRCRPYDRAEMASARSAADSGEHPASGSPVSRTGWTGASTRANAFDAV